MPPLRGKRLFAGMLLGAAAAGASAQPCDRTYAASPQFSVDACVFRNAENPLAQPSQPAWKIWSRFLTPAPPGTRPVDAIPVRRVDAAMLQALDAGATT